MLQNFVSTFATSAAPGRNFSGVLCGSGPASSASQEPSKGEDRQLIRPERWVTGQDAEGSRGRGARADGSNYAGAIFCLHKNILSNQR